MPQQHELAYIGTTRSGAEIWQCPRCPHRMLTRRQPSFSAELITEGDPGVAHVGNLGDAMAAGQPLRGPAARLTSGERSWLDHNGIDWDGTRPGWDEPAA